MRLGQLSRQLEVSSEQIVILLKEHFREVNNHPNIKLTEEELHFIEDYFSPKEEAAEKTPIVEEPDTTQEEPSKENKESKDNKKVPEFVESLRPQVITLEDEFQAQTEDLETFKVEKPQLEGLKVVGKIDLPEPVIKEKETTPEREEKRPRDRKQNRKRDDRKPNRNRGNSAIAERQKAERLAKKKRIEEEQRLKELKKKHYEENVKAKFTPVTPKKKKKKAEVADTAKVNVSLQGNVVQSQKPTAKNPLKRFWLWLNGAYDK